jgi:hypothetical protein
MKDLFKTLGTNSYKLLSGLLYIYIISTFFYKMILMFFPQLIIFNSIFGLFLFFAIISFFFYFFNPYKRSTFMIQVVTYLNKNHSWFLSFLLTFFEVFYVYIRGSYFTILCFFSGVILCLSQITKFNFLFISNNLLLFFLVLIYGNILFRLLMNLSFATYFTLINLDMFYKIKYYTLFTVIPPDLDQINAKTTKKSFFFFSPTYHHHYPSSNNFEFSQKQTEILLRQTQYQKHTLLLTGAGMIVGLGWAYYNNVTLQNKVNVLQSDLQDQKTINETQNETNKRELEARDAKIAQLEKKRWF